MGQNFKFERNTEKKREYEWIIKRTFQPETVKKKKQKSIVKKVKFQRETLKKKRNTKRL